ncbi:MULTISPECIES: sec-independent translocase [unclassified Streptomyces]|uniref:sec-independent translocase n=1 Tax=Streptomyces TaxID=1883 RepID=UPI0008239DD6|nr:MULTISPECIES: sec-independent translocase [unclassified Streptomyces]MCW7989213.1 translocase [Streptomyces platensis subsp. clarensis]MYT12072.1 Sec-independent protein translocase TatB [Streptomyces sp. SID4951]AWN29350.1 Sec-independent protein translocase TatB [Streptomyces sp. NEAU-S7GS2]MCR8579242.1 sec-independent translocase [Streptomyces sp. Isolate_219]UYB40095.1 sec-independent translocase [Streptomyces sp. Je 1-4]
MFFDIGPLELVALVILAVLIFGPDKLPKVIQDVMSFVRKVRAFSDSAKEDIRSELGPEFKDFEFEDLKPKNFVRKHVLEKDEYGLKDLQEIRNGFDLKKEMAEVTDAVHGHDSASSATPSNGSGPSLSKESPAASAGSPDMVKRAAQPDERPPFDADAT